nr:hypothetical protein [Pelagibacteraceae bacterium]
MHFLNYKVFNYLDNSKPIHLGIYFSLFFHLSILLFAVGLPDFFKPKQIIIPQVIPIEILNVSDVTSLTPRNENIEIDIKQTKKVKQKKFNSSENTEIQKIDLQEKPKKKITKNENTIDNNFTIDNNISEKLETLKISIKEKPINKLKNEKNVKVNNIETLKINKIKPKLKPKPLEKKEIKSDLDIENKIKPIIEINNEKKIIDKPKPIKKPEQDFNIASMLKDLRNEEVSNVSAVDNKENDKVENNKEENQIKPNLEVSISEMDLVIQQLRSCFNPRAGTQIIGDEMVKIRAEVDRNAFVKKDTVQIIDTNISKSNPYYEAITESAVATLYNPLCVKLKLPLDKYESWKDLTIIIDYSWIKN